MNGIHQEIRANQNTNDIIKEIIPHVKTHLEQRWPFEMDGKTIFLFLFSFDYYNLSFLLQLIDKLTLGFILSSLLAQ